jgi:inhibitor of KinA
VEYNPVLISYSELQSLIFEGIRNISQSSSRHSRKVWIPVCYGGEYGPDLEDVARHNKLSPDEVVRIHSEPAYFIHFTGFLPGFPFLGGMSKRIATPRLPTPRPYVPGGSVGIAGEQTGVYPIDSPGGWRLIGRVPVKLYDRRRPDPFVFQEGDYLKFFPITPDEYQEIQESDAVEPYRFRIEDLGTIDQFEREGP